MSEISKISSIFVIFYEYGIRSVKQLLLKVCFDEAIFEIYQQNFCHLVQNLSDGMENLFGLN